MVKVPEGWEVETTPETPAVDQSTAVTEMAAAPIPEGFEVAESAQLSPDEFEVELKKRLDDPEFTREDIVAWSGNAGHPIVETPDFEKNWQIAQQARKEGKRGVYGRVIDTPEGTAVSDITADDVGAFFRGMNTFTQLGDEALAAAQAAPAAFDADRNFEDEYRQNWLNMQMQEITDEELSGGPRTAGQIGGYGIGALIPFSGIRAGAGLLPNALRSGGIGAVEGAITGTGEGAPGDRFGGTLPGAAVGGTLGAGIPVVGRSVDAIARPLREVVSTRLPGRGEKAPLNVLGRRLDISPERMRETAAEYRAAGIEPTAFDVVGEVGQDVIGSMARRQTPARGQMQTYADELRVNLPDRVRTQAERISTEARNPDELVSDIEKARDERMSAVMDTIRSEPLPMDDEVMNVLTTEEGHSAIRAAMQLETNPTVRDNFIKLGQVVRQAQRIDPRLPAGTRNQIMGQMIQDVGFDVNMADKISRSLKGAAGRAGAGGDAGRARVLREFGNTVRDAAKANPIYAKALADYGQQSGAARAVRTGEELMTRNTDAFVKAAGELSDVRPTQPFNTQGRLEEVEEALNDDGSKVAIGKYVTPEGDQIGFSLDMSGGRGFVSINGKNFDTWEQAANTVGPATVRDMQRVVQNQWPELKTIAGKRATGASAGTPAATTEVRLPAPRTGPSERDLARAGAKRAIERRTETPRQAAQTAEVLAIGPEQRMRMEALLGPEEATRVANAMAAELERTRSAALRAPRSGSRTALNMADDSVLGDIAAVATNPTSIAAWTRAGIGALTRAGISDRVAQEVVQIALDPTRTDEAIEYLAKRMSGNATRARALIDTVRSAGVRAITEE